MFENLKSTLYKVVLQTRTEIVDWNMSNFCEEWQYLN